MCDEYVPPPEERRRLLATIPVDTGTALRLVGAFADGDGADATAVMDEIAAGGLELALRVLGTTAMLASRLAYGLVEHVGDDPQLWLDAAALGVVDGVHERLDEADGK